MAVLFAANELESFTRSDVTAVIPDDSKAGSFRAEHTRHAIRISEFQELRADMASTSEVWVHFSIMAEDFGNYAQDDHILKIMSGNLNHVRLDGSDGLLALDYSVNGSTAYVKVTPSFLPPDDTLLDFDIHAKLGVEGHLAFYIDGSLITELDIDTSLWSSSTFDNIRISQADTSTSPTYYMWFSEIIVADEPTLGWNLKTLQPEADGTLSEFTGTFADVNEADSDDLDFVSSGTAGQVQLFDPPVNGTEFNGKSIKAVVVGGRAEADGAGPLNLQAAVRSGGTNYFSGNLAVTSAFAPTQSIFANNPDTSSAWDKTAVDAIEYGYRSQA